MKIDLTKNFVYPMGTNREDKMAEVLAIRAFQGDGMQPENDADKRAKNAMELYRLYTKLSNAKPDTDWSPEELVLIKRVAASLLPGLYGQVVTLVDGHA